MLECVGVCRNCPRPSCTRQTFWPVHSISLRIGTILRGRLVLSMFGSLLTTGYILAIWSEVQFRINFDPFQHFSTQRCCFMLKQFLILCCFRNNLCCWRLLTNTRCNFRCFCHRSTTLLLIWSQLVPACDDEYDDDKIDYGYLPAGEMKKGLENTFWTGYRGDSDERAREQMAQVEKWMTILESELLWWMFFIYCIKRSF